MFNIQVTTDMCKHHLSITYIKAPVFSQLNLVRLVIFVGKWIPKTKVFVNFGLILRWAPHVRWVGTTLERVLLREEMKFVYSQVKIH